MPKDLNVSTQFQIDSRAAQIYSSASQAIRAIQGDAERSARNGTRSAYFQLLSSHIFVSTFSTLSTQTEFRSRDELAATAGENAWTPDQARPILLAASAGESRHTAALWSHAAKVCGAPITSRVGEPRTETDFGAERDWRRKSV